MDQEVLKAINDVSRRLGEVEQKLDEYFLEKHLINSASIEDTDMAVMELAALINDVEAVQVDTLKLEEEHDNG